MKAWTVFLLLGIAAIAAAVTMIVMERAEIADASDWPSVEGSIAFSRLDEQESVGNKGARHRTYLPRVVYFYTVDGRIHRGDRLWLAAPETWGNRDSAEAFLESYRAGGKVNVYYDPADPQRSALIVGGSSWWLYILAGLGVLLAAFGLFIRRARNRAAA